MTVSGMKEVILWTRKPKKKKPKVRIVRATIVAITFSILADAIWLTLAGVDT